MGLVTMRVSFRSTTGGGGSVEDSAFGANDAAGARLKSEAHGFRDRLHHLLRSLDELVESDETVDPAALDRIRGILRSRRLRDRFFEAGLFADPAWDILLDLYRAELGRYRVPVSSLCIAAAVPATTALRWIKTLEQKGLVLRQADPNHGRRIYVSLSTEAARAMERLLSALPATEPLI
jgi:DNA-binding MarR family transcriptional regulator